MNPTVSEILDYYFGKSMSVDVEDHLMHYGMPRRSGRYPWGSGEHPYQRTDDFLSRIKELESEGKTEKEVADALGLTTTQLRAQKSLAVDERRSLDVATAKSLREHGYSLKQIADKMGFKNDSSVRSLLNENSERRMNQAKNTAERLKKLVEEKGMIDVGAGVEKELGVSKEKLDQALYILEREGFPVYGGGVPQATNPGKQTNLRVLCPPGTEHKEIYNYDQIQSAGDYLVSYDGGETFKKAFEYPSSMDSKRLMINYAEDGGKDKDGVVELRRGVQDLSLGESNYAQVRIMVDGTHYIKGMAVYADDLPPGIDVRFNTNKSEGTPVEKVLKPIKDDPNNPFGSLIKEHGGQSYYDDPDGKFIDEATGKRQSLSLINKRAEEGDWDEWSRHLSAQFLSKQNKDLIKRQLDLSVADKEDEYSEICSLTNPTVKRVLLESFASDCDAAAVHLKAAALPRQRYQVLLPLTSIKDDEVYAPNFKDGETVALVRFPHGGTFEIPVLKVNNKVKEGKSVIGTNPLDAIGINSKVAGVLSGADFDGDTVLVIPTNNKTKISSRKPFDGLKDFDPKSEYGGTPKSSDDPDILVNSKTGKTYKRMKNTQTEMGKVSNLITDMTLKGASDDEIERAVKHSMVVIDAEKHGLDYKQSAMDNNIPALKKKYQGRVEEGRYREGASTLISRASSEQDVLKRKGQPWINKETGEEEWERTNPKTGKFESKILQETYVDKKGKTQTRTQKSTQMAETKDAHTLSSGTTQEELYANYANHMKGLGNRARKEMISTGRLKYNAEANKQYKEEVSKMNADLNIALMNAPRERQAQIIASSVVAAKKKANPDMTKKEKKKIAQQALVEARLKVGAKRHEIQISDKQWEAIQAGAVSDNVLTQILKHANIDTIKEKATPRTKTTISQAKVNKIKAMKSSGYTTSEIAEGTGLSESTIIRYLKGKE